jgi:hypothetical protein
VNDEYLHKRNIRVRGLHNIPLLESDSKRSRNLHTADTYSRRILTYHGKTDTVLFDVDS